METNIAVAVALVYVRRKQHWSACHLWVHPILQTKDQYGEFCQLVQELRLDSDHSQWSFRLDIALFDDLFVRVGLHIRKQSVSLTHRNSCMYSMCHEQVGLLQFSVYGSFKQNNL